MGRVEIRHLEAGIRSFSIRGGFFATLPFIDSSPLFFSVDPLRVGSI